MCAVAKHFAGKTFRGLCFTRLRVETKDYFEVLFSILISMHCFLVASYRILWAGCNLFLSKVSLNTIEASYCYFDTGLLYDCRYIQKSNCVIGKSFR